MPDFFGVIFSEMVPAMSDQWYGRRYKYTVRHRLLATPLHDNDRDWEHRRVQLREDVTIAPGDSQHLRDCEFASAAPSGNM